MAQEFTLQEVGNAFARSYPKVLPVKRIIGEFKAFEKFNVQLSEEDIKYHWIKFANELNDKKDTQ